MGTCCSDGDHSTAVSGSGLLGVGMFVSCSDDDGRTALNRCINGVLVDLRALVSFATEAEVNNLGWVLVACESWNVTARSPRDAVGDVG